MSTLRNDSDRGFTWLESLAIGFAATSNLPAHLVIDTKRLHEVTAAIEEDRAIRKMLPRDSEWTVEVIQHGRS